MTLRALGPFIGLPTRNTRAARRVNINPQPFHKLLSDGHRQCRVRPALSYNHRYVTLEAICWRKYSAKELSSFGSGSFNASTQEAIQLGRGVRRLAIRSCQLVLIFCYFMFRKTHFCRFRYLPVWGPHFIPPFKFLTERYDVAVSRGCARAWFVLGAGYDKLLKVVRPTVAFLTQTQQPAK
jgi:hypothetical protein